MSEQVRRYDYGYVDDGNGSRYLGLIERDTGKLVRHDDYDALHAEAEALRVVLLEIASVNPAERGIEWAKSYASDGLKGAGSELYARWLETFKEAEALRLANNCYRATLRSVLKDIRDDIARGGLAESWSGVAETIAIVLEQEGEATPVPEVPDHFAEASKMVWQGERQEAVASNALRQRFSEIEDEVARGKHNAMSCFTAMRTAALYIPQPSQDVRALVEAMNFACKSLCHVTSSDGSGHADIALSVLRMAGVDGEERERLVDGWKASCQWRIDKAHRQAQSQA